MKIIRNTIIWLSAMMALAACTEDRITQQPVQGNSTSRSAAEGVRTVPLYIYLPTDNASSRAAGVTTEFSNSGGEKGYHTSEAHTLKFYVFKRTKGNNSAEFTYSSADSDPLNTSPITLTEREYSAGKKFYSARTEIKTMDDGHEYKILVTASGKAKESGYQGTRKNKKWTDVKLLEDAVQDQDAKPLTYFVKKNDGTESLVNGDKLSDLKVKVTPKAVAKVPETKYETNNNPVPTKDVDAYSIQECFYGYCVNVNSETEESTDIITSTSPKLKAFLHRNVARVEFNATNIYYKYRILGIYYYYDIKWMGIYARSIRTECNASTYDDFSINSEGDIVNDDWKLLTYYSIDETNYSAKRFSNLFGDAFDEDKPGLFNFVTYMLPAKTQFKVRLVYKRRKYSDNVYCVEDILPITAKNEQESKDEDGEGSIGIVQQGTHTLPGDSLAVIRRNRRYFFSFDLNALVRSTEKDF